MNFSDKSRYDRIFEQVTHKGGESALSYIKIFKNSQVLSVSAGNSYSEDELIHIFLDNFHQGGKYTEETIRHQAELRREKKTTCQKSLAITCLKPKNLNLASSSGSGENIERANLVHTKYTFCGVANHSTKEYLKKGRTRE